MRFGFLSAALTAGLLLSGAATIGFLHPATPLPPEWNPTRPLDLSRPATALTPLKLRWAATGEACFTALSTAGAAFQRLPDLTEGAECGIRDRLTLTGLGDVRIRPVETRCATALRLALWHRHGLAPLAADQFGRKIREIHHLDSYNCRPIRTPEGQGARMSLHATGEAIDITGVTLDDGTRIDLLADWGAGPEGAFLRTARDEACTWFATTLGPDYNVLHADHFHLQSRGWGTCR